MPEKGLLFFLSTSLFTESWRLSGFGSGLLLRHLKGHVLADLQPWPRLLHRDPQRKSCTGHVYRYNNSKGCVCCVLPALRLPHTALPLMTSGMRQQSLSELISQTSPAYFHLISSYPGALDVRVVTCITVLPLKGRLHFSHASWVRRKRPRFNHATRTEKLAFHLPALELYEHLLGLSSVSISILQE